jgi:hypothetical protein
MAKLEYINEACGASLEPKNLGGGKGSLIWQLRSGANLNLSLYKTYYTE